MNKIILNLLLLVSYFFSYFANNAFASTYDFIEAQNVYSMPKLGSGSCYITYGGENAKNLRVCSATLITNHQISYSKDCVTPVAARQRVETYLYCQNGTVKRKVSFNNQAKNNDLNHLSLSEALPLKTLSYKRDAKIEDSEYTKCFIKTGRKYVLLKPLERTTTLKNGIVKDPILNVSDYGAGVYCLNKSNEEQLIGLYGKDGKILNLREFEELNKTNFTNIQLNEPASEGLSQVCQEGFSCLRKVSTQVMDLTADMINVLNQLKDDIENIDKNQELEDLEIDYKKIRSECNKISIDLTQQNDQDSNAGFMSGAMGKVEAGAISAVGLFNDDFLLNQFKDVEIIAENLSPEKIRSVFSEVTKANKDLSKIDLIKKLTSEYTKEIVKKIALDMDVLRNDDSRNYNDLVRDLMKNFDLCLNDANSKNTVLACADKFSKSAAVKIAEIEMENQLGDNFEKLFENKEEYLKLKISAKDSYYRCITKYYYREDNIENNNKAKGCVYMSILTAYNKTKDVTIEQYLKDAKVQANDIPGLKQKIFNSSNNCQYGPILNSTNTNSVSEFETLSILDIENFKEDLDSCIKTLSLNAGRVITEQTVKNHPQINDIIKDPKRVSQITESVALRLFDKCIEVQPKKESDPNKCRDVITAITTLEVAKSEVFKAIKDVSEGNKDLESDISTKVEDKIISCQKNLEDEYLAKMAESQNLPKEQKTVQCLLSGVKEIVSKITAKTLSDKINNDPLMKEYANDILKLKEIKELDKFTVSCFEEKFKNAQTIDQFTKDIDKVKEECTFLTTKKATVLISPIVLERKLASAIEDPKKAKILAQNYTAGNKGLIARLEKAVSSQELDLIVTQITPDLTIKGAEILIPKLVDEMLKDFDAKTKESIKKDLISSMNSCIRSLDIKDKQINAKVDKCINKSTLEGYEKIGGLIISKNIFDVLAPDKGIAHSLVNQSKLRFSKCAQNIDLGVSPDNYKSTINKCMIDEVASLSIDIPREAIILYAPEVGLDINKDKLRNELKKVEDYYLNRTSTLPNKYGEYLLDSHAEHMQCISNAQKELKRVNETDMNKVQAAYKLCTDNVEGNVKQGIVNIFTNKHAGSKNDPDKAAMLNLGSTLIGLTSNVKDESSEVKPLKDTFSQMHMVGEKFKTVCNLDHKKCYDVALKTRRDIDAFKKKNPNATGDELFNKFIESDVLDLIVKTEISNSLQAQLLEGMKDYLDKENILKSQIVEITKLSSVEKLMSSTQGKKVKADIIKSIKDGSIDKIMEDNKFRAEFAKLLTNDTSNDSFIDKLIFGIVQPMVVNERQTSSGLGGIFRNPKVAIGRLFGIVQGKDFDWLKIRNNNYGKEAREIFAKEIFAPIVAGVELDKQPSTNKKYKNRLEQLTASIEEKITAAIKSM